MKKPTLIILGGFAGAGKTTVAQRFSSEFNFPIIGTDELNAAIRKAFNIDFHNASPYAHDIAWSLVRDYLKNNVSVILDTNMCRERTWQNLDDVKIDFPFAHVLPIILECSLETHRKRIDYRGATQRDHLNLGGDKLEDVLTKYEYIKTLNRTDLIRINAEGTPQDVYKNVLNVIKFSSPQSL